MREPQRRRDAEGAGPRGSGPSYVFALCASAAIALLSCVPPAPAKRVAVDFVASNLAAPAGAALEQACTPTGPEMCFNAVDDNCNGVFDEGCGIQSGVLQWEIAWGDSPALVELLVTDPAGVETCWGTIWSEDLTGGADGPQQGSARSTEARKGKARIEVPT